jgi:hypothetical protein
MLLRGHDRFLQNERGRFNEVLVGLRFVSRKLDQLAPMNDTDLKSRAISIFAGAKERSRLQLLKCESDIDLTLIFVRLFARARKKLYFFFLSFAAKRQKRKSVGQSRFLNSTPSSSAEKRSEEKLRERKRSIKRW